MSASDIKIRFLIQREKYAEAQALLLTRLAEAPNDPDLHLMMAEVLWRRDRPKEAEAAAKTAIGLDPDSGFPHELLAHILLDSANLKGAEEAIKQANALDGDSAGSRAVLARIASERNQPQRCLEHAEAGLEMEPDHDACRFFKGIALGKLGRHEEAEATALGLLGDDPDDAANHCARGWILLERNDTKTAIQHFQEALRIDPESEDARTGLVRCLQQRNPLLGWLLRAINALERLSWNHMLIAVLLVGIFLPRFLRGEGMPPAAVMIGQVLRVGMMTFFCLSVAAGPLFSALLLVSREGRNALGSQQLKATLWSLLPLLGGLVYLGLWIAKGGKFISPQAIGLLCCSTLLYESFTLPHPWVRQRMLAITGIAGLCTVWLLIGPFLVFKPILQEMVGQLETLGKGVEPKALAANIAQQITDLARLNKQLFAYPALILYTLTAFSDKLIAALLRRAPDPAN